MSFILDALKKSESERHRNSGPVLMDVRIAPPRRRLPAWAWIIIAVLVANFMVLAWLLWLSPAKRSAKVQPPAVAAAAAPATQASAAPVPAPSAATALPAPSLPPPLPAQPAAGATTAAPAAPQVAAMPAIDTGSLPRYQDLVSAGIGLPAIQLNLHVHDAQPASRYVLLNGVKLREGESTPDGLKVLQIVPTGVALEMRGQRFFMNAGG
ncbi:MAG TPA: general secretion pathway protein GspB [Steroidobacteraceae bacterium]|nr:general secretion pathway protein GspB [Steroidobacteraceae bacterium]